jgi:arylsulfatase A-like enzyme
MLSNRNVFAIREGNWKLILGQGSGGNTSAGYKTGPLPSTDPAQPRGQLYHLVRNTGETSNLYGNHPEIVGRLTALVEKIRPKVAA